MRKFNPEILYTEAQSFMDINFDFGEEASEAFVHRLEKPLIPPTLVKIASATGWIILDSLAGLGKAFGASGLGHLGETTPDEE